MPNEGLSAGTEPAPAPEGDAADEMQSLRRCIRDLAGLSALSAVWVGYDAQRLAESLVDVLGNTLDLHLIFVRVHTAANGAVFDVARTRLRGRESPEQAGELAGVLTPWLESEHATPSASISSPLGSGYLQITVTPIGYSGHGVLIAGSERMDFPTASERLLFSVAINQAAVVLQQREAGTERKLLEDALAQRVEELAAASRRKDEFLAMLGHELRSPLSPIRHAAHLLKLRSERDPALQQVQQIIERQVTHLARLVDDLLDVARITRGHVELRKTELDLAEIVGEAVEAIREGVDTRGHDLSVLLPLEPVRVVGDRTRLVQVIGNVLANAAKYTPDGGRLQLRAELKGSAGALQVALHFRDNGQGMASDLLPHVFDLFTQAERSLDRSEGGLGIGLTLVKELVEQHGGTVEAHSAGLGQGSEFIVRLPVLAPVALRPCDTPQPEPISGPSRRVLVVEDNRDAAATLQELLVLWGHEVQVAHDGPAALQAAAGFLPDVILMDIGLPYMDGYEVARRIRAEGAAGNALLIALTGYGHEEHGATAVAAGFDDRLVKPVDPERLQRLLVQDRAPCAAPERVASSSAVSPP